MFINESGELVGPKHTVFGWGWLRQIYTGIEVPDALDFWMDECLERNGSILFNDAILNKIEPK